MSNVNTVPFVSLDLEFITVTEMQALPGVLEVRDYGFSDGGDRVCDLFVRDYRAAKVLANSINGRFINAWGSPPNCGRGSLKSEQMGGRGSYVRVVWDEE